MDQKFQMTVTPTPHPDLELTNYAYCSPSDLEKFQTLMPSSRKTCLSTLSTNKKLFLAALSDDSMVLSISAYKGVKDGHIALNSCQLETAEVSAGASVSISKFVPPDAFNLKILVLDIDSCTSKSDSEINAVELGNKLRRQFVNQVMTAGQQLSIMFEGAQYNSNVSGALVQGQNNGDVIERGLVTSKTKFVFKTPHGGNIKVINQQEASCRLPLKWDSDFQSFDTDLRSFGIGGLKEEYTKLLDKVFRSRYFPPYHNKRNVKGALLYGTPGTGKSLLGQKIAQMFGPMGKFISCAGFGIRGGEAEKTVREFLLNAKKDQKIFGDHSDLRVLVLDQFDYIANRGWRSGNKNSIKRRILRMIDKDSCEEEQSNNIIIIAIATRRELIDGHFLQRYGLEVEVEFKAPDKKGRLEILQLCVPKVIEPQRLAPDVSLEYIAHITQGCSGADLVSIIHDAYYAAAAKPAFLGLLSPHEIVITRSHFVNATTAKLAIIRDTRFGMQQSGVKWKC